ncbi:MAG: TonB C-terminal domain-containing protein [Candidatus Dependentiae bacterium]
MWRWQVKKYKEFISENHIFFTALALASAGHLFLLLFFIVGYKTNNELHITIKQSYAPAQVVLMPLVKRTQPVPQKNNQQPKPITVSKKISKTTTPKTTAIKKAETNIKPEPTKKSVQKSSPKKTVALKEASKKTVPQKKEEVVRAKKTIEKKETQPTKPQEKKQLAEQKIVEKAPKEETKVTPIKELAKQKEVARADVVEIPQEPIYVGYEQYQELEMQEYFRQEIVRNWSPPPGFSNDTACEIKLVISGSGVIEKIEVCKSSGSLAYDTSVKLAVKLINVPKWAYNKSIHLYFKQS